MLNRRQRIFKDYGHWAGIGGLFLILLLAIQAPYALPQHRTPQEDPPAEGEANQEGEGDRLGDAERPAREGPDPTPPPEGIRKVVGKIRGTVLGPEEEPVVGLLVQLVSDDGRGTLRVTGTDEKGQYLFRDLPAGVYRVQVDLEGYQGQVKDGIEVRPPFQNLVDFQLDAAAEGPPRSRSGSGERFTDASSLPPVPVSGVLVDQDESPLVEVSVILIPQGGEKVFQAYSGDDGRFLFDAVPPGRYRVLIASPGHVPLDLKSVMVSAESGLDLSLSLVDYPLNYERRREGELPREEPREAPPETDAGANSSA